MIYIDYDFMTACAFYDERWLRNRMALSDIAQRDPSVWFLLFSNVFVSSS